MAEKEDEFIALKPSQMTTIDRFALA